MEHEVEIEGKTYKIGAMDVFRQFHVARRLAALAPAIVDFIAIPEKQRNITQLFYPLTEVLSTMPEDDVNYILQSCMAVVTRKEATGWAKIQSGGGLMFDDITMPIMLKITWDVLQKDIVSFFPTAQPTQETVTATI